MVNRKRLISDECTGPQLSLFMAAAINLRGVRPKAVSELVTAELALLLRPPEVGVLLLGSAGFSVTHVLVGLRLWSVRCAGSAWSLLWQSHLRQWLLQVWSCTGRAQAVT